MAKIPVEDYLSKLIGLEQSVGAHTAYEVLEPFYFRTRDAINIQKAAKKIAEFIGLNNFRFIVAVAKQKENVGGHIELQNDGTDVFIEISEQSLMFSQAVLATLAHELTHKYLHVHRISCGIGKEYERENEVLTDISAVYLGLGKLMLNGCECQRESKERTSQGVQTNTQTLRSGYLTREQFAFVYRLVCGMRKIPASTYLGGLSLEARSALSQCASRYKNFFSTDFHNPDEILEIKHSLEDEIAPINRHLTNLEIQLLHVKKILESHVDAFLKTSQKRLTEMRADTFGQIDGDIHNPSLRYLLTVKCDCDVEALMSEVNKLNKGAELYVDCLLNLAKVVRRYEGKIPELPSAPEIHKSNGDARRKSFLARIWSRTNR
ncbi:MAG TPA: hypothetical protein DCK93_02285 [Blastocatellia bacterium]|nr:hypothetical protein [Blastocatellia bacterium]